MFTGKSPILPSALTSHFISEEEVNKRLPMFQSCSRLSGW